MEPKPPTSTSIYLNIYDRYSTNNIFILFGTGSYHLGIHFNGREYSYNYDVGLYSLKPGSIKNLKLRQNIKIGNTLLSSQEILNNLFDVKEYLDYKLVLDTTSNVTFDFCNLVSIQLFDLPLPQYLHRFPYLDSLLCRPNLDIMWKGEDQKIEYKNLT